MITNKNPIKHSRKNEERLRRNLNNALKKFNAERKLVTKSENKLEQMEQTIIKLRSENMKLQRQVSYSEELVKTLNSSRSILKKNGDKLAITKLLKS